MDSPHTYNIEAVAKGYKWEFALLSSEKEVLERHGLVASDLLVKPTTAGKIYPEMDTGIRWACGTTTRAKKKKGEIWIGDVFDPVRCW